MPPLCPPFDPIVSSPEEIAGSFRAVPSLPSILVRLSEQLREGSTSFAELARLVRLDAGLVCRVFEECSVSSRAVSYSCFSIEDALNQLGREAVLALVRDVIRRQVLSLPLEAYSLDADEYWRWSVATAMGAELLAELTGDDSDFSFTVGLLHNVGASAIDHWLRSESAGIAFYRRAHPEDYSSSENAVLGFSQATVGAALLDRWRLPLTVTEVIRTQYTPSTAGAHARASSVLHLAKWLGCAVCAEDRVPKLPQSRYTDVLRISSHELSRLVLELRFRIGRVRGEIYREAA